MIQLWEMFADFMKASVAPHLRALHAPLDAWIDGLPGWVPIACALTLFIVAGLWVLTLKRDYIYLGAPDRAAWRDLRFWAVLVLLPYVLIYLLF